MATAPYPTAPTTPGLGPARRLVLAAGGVVLLAAIAWGALTAVAFLGRTTTTTVSTLAPTGPGLTVDAGAGDIDVTPSRDGRIRIETRLHYGLRRPRVEQHVTAAGVKLSARCPWFDGGCQVRYRIAVPPGGAVTLRTGSGNIRVRGADGPTTLRTGSGDIRAEDIGGGLTARTGSGNIVGSDLRGATADARTGSGDIRLTLAGTPTALTLDTGSGNVAVALPGGTSYAVDVHTGSGNRRVDVPTDPASPHRIAVRTGSGDVSLRVAGGR